MFNAIVDNIPLFSTMIPLVKEIGTLTGMAKKEGHKISFMQYAKVAAPLTKVAAPLTFVTLLLTTIYLYIRFSFQKKAQ